MAGVVKAATPVVATVKVAVGSTGAVMVSVTASELLPAKFPAAV